MQDKDKSGNGALERDSPVFRVEPTSMSAAPHSLGYRSRVQSISMEPGDPPTRSEAALGDTNETANWVAVLASLRVISSNLNIRVEISSSCGDSEFSLSPFPAGPTHGEGRLLFTLFSFKKSCFAHRSPYRVTSSGFHRLPRPSSRPTSKVAEKPQAEQQPILLATFQMTSSRSPTIRPWRPRFQSSAVLLSERHDYLQTGCCVQAGGVIGYFSFYNKQIYYKTVTLMIIYNWKFYFEFYHMIH